MTAQCAAAPREHFLEKRKTSAPRMAIGVEPRAKKLYSGLDSALLLQPVCNAMAFDSLAQPPGAVFPVPETPTFQASEDLSEPNPALPGQSAETLSQRLANKKRRPSKEKTSTAALRRSSSTPHMRNVALGTGGDVSPTGDKRRNKLGYHRTSVACGHCRRRKIRCLVADNETTGRCANCIRLKKECNFYPVDQPPDVPRAQAVAAKDGVAVAPGSSTTSSPRHPASASGERMDEIRPPFLNTMPRNAIPGYAVPGDSEAEPHQTNPPSALPVQQPAFYPPAIETQWQPTILPSSSIAESPSSSTGYWRPSPSTANSTFGSDVSGGHTPVTISSTSTMSYGPPSENQHWPQPGFQPPVRSMSYGNIEGLPQQYANAGLGIQTADFPRRPSPYPYPTTIDTTNTSLHTSSLGSATPGPLSAPILPNHHYNYAPPWNPYSGGQTSAHDMPLPGRTLSGQWYGEPGPLSQVQEEGVPPMAFPGQGVSQFFSGP